MNIRSVLGHFVGTFTLERIVICVQNLKRLWKAESFILFKFLSLRVGFQVMNHLTCLVQFMWLAKFFLFLLNKFCVAAHNHQKLASFSPHFYPW